jgi:hypothetical protein
MNDCIQSKKMPLGEERKSPLETAWKKGLLSLLGFSLFSSSS